MLPDTSTANSEIRVSIATANNNLKIEPAFQLQGTLFSLYILNILTENTEQLLFELKELIAQSPKFFDSAPLVIHCPHVNFTDAEFGGLLAELKRLNFMPIGLKNDSPNAKHWSALYQLALFPAHKLKARTLVDKAHNVTDTSASEALVEQGDTVATEAKEDDLIHTSSLFINHPVRSGNQIYAQGCDLIVHGPVSYGAELLADGHIHVYGPLRGRALAGVNGNTDARIYCHSLEAELLSIAGHYWLSDDLKKAHKKNVCVFFKAGQLALETMN